MPDAYDSGDVAMMTPLLPMHSLGYTFIPPAIHAGAAYATTAWPRW